MVKSRTWRRYSKHTEVPYSIIRQITEKVAEKNCKLLDEEKVIDLSIGQNFLGKPKVIFSHITWLMEKNFDTPILYEPSLGSIDTRRKMAENFYSNWYTIPRDSYDYNNIMITDGAFGAVRNALLAIMNPGDLLVVDRFTFRYFIEALVIAGRQLQPFKVYIVPSKEDGCYIASAESILEFLEKLHYNNPDKNIVYYTQFGFNPTGCFRKSSELKVLVEGIEENPRLFLVNDIAYHLIRWEIKDIPLATYFAQSGDGIVDADSLSKPFGLMGIRVGALITKDSELFRRAARVQQYSIVSPNKLAVNVWDVLATSSYSKEIKEEVLNLNSQIKENLLLTKKYLREINIEVLEPTMGTIYAFIKSPEPASTFWKKLLDGAKVAVVPGTAFTDSSDPEGEKYLRATISVPKESLERALSRIIEYGRKQISKRKTVG
ncbi:MAG: pyridoxal phosphate-dependent aminotransferase [Candidatus Njordarchaeum guaymaensis]